MPSGARRWRTVALAGALGVLLVAAVQRELAGSTGPGQLVLVPLVGIAFAAAALVAPGAFGLALGAVSLAWLAGSVHPTLLVVHQGVLLVALAVLATRRRGILVAVSAVALPMALGLLNLGAVAVTFAVCGAALLATRPRSGPAVVSASSAFLVALVIGGLEVAGRRLGADFVPDVGLLLYEVALLVVAGLLGWAAGPRHSPLGDLALSDRRANGFEGLSEVLGELLGDPSFRVQVDQREEPVSLGGTQETPVLTSGRVAATLLHREGLLDDPRIREAVANAVRLVAASVDRRALLDHRTAQLVAARARVDTARDRRRHDVASVVGDQAMAPLRRAVIELDAWSDRGGDEASVEVALAAQQMHTALADLEGLVRGAPPAVLGEGRLGPAIARLAEQSPVPTTVDLDDIAAPPLVEAALFFVCSETLANAHKHASANGLHVQLRRTGDAIVLTVTDDGTGGVDPAGSGISGLADRLDVVGGRLVVSSPPGVGTTVRAEVPIS